MFPTLGRPATTPVGPKRAGLTGHDLAALARASKVPGGLAAGGPPDELVDWFAVVGTSAEVADRLVEITRLGLSHLYLVSHAPSTRRELAEECRSLLVNVVLPKLRASL